MRAPLDPLRPCTHCGRSPGEVEFGTRTRDGLRHSWCKSCQSGAVRESVQLRRRVVKIDPDIAHWFRDAAVRSGFSTSDIVHDALRRYIAQVESARAGVVTVSQLRGA